MIQTSERWSAPGEEAKTAWRKITEALRHELDPQNYETWFGPAVLVGANREMGKLRICVPTEEFRDKIIDDWRAPISGALKGNGFRSLSVEVRGRTLDSPSRQSDDAEARLRLVRIGDLMAQPRQSTDWIVDGLLPSQSPGILGGKPKVGKTVIAEQMLFSVSRGEPIFGRATIKGPCIYLALEHKLSEIRAHFELMGASGREDIFVHAGDIGIENLADVESEIKLRKARLVVIDPLWYFLRVRDANSYGDVAHAMRTLVRVARNNSAHILGVHHLTKRDTPNPGDSILGSTALFAAVDTAILLQRGPRFSTIQSRQRFGEDLPETELFFDRTNQTFTLGKVKAEALAASVEVRMVSFFRNAGASVTEEQIVGEVEGRLAVKRTVLRQLLRDGRITRSGGGRPRDPYRYGLLAAPDITREEIPLFEEVR